VNDLKLKSINEIGEQFYDYEFWSQLLIRHFFPTNYSRVVIKPTRFNLTSRILVLVGEIASGKTTLAKKLVDNFEFASISSRECVAELIDEKDFGTKNRHLFQEKAERFIKGRNGPALLARKIHTEVLKYTQNIVIDGIRHSETLKDLKKLHAELVVIY